MEAAGLLRHLVQRGVVSAMLTGQGNLPPGHFNLITEMIMTTHHDDVCTMFVNERLCVVYWCGKLHAVYDLRLDEVDMESIYQRCLTRNAKAEIRAHEIPADMLSGFKHDEYPECTCCEKKPVAIHKFDRSPSEEEQDEERSELTD